MRNMVKLLDAAGAEIEARPGVVIEHKEKNKKFLIYRFVDVPFEAADGTESLVRLFFIANAKMVAASSPYSAYAMRKAGYVVSKTVDIEPLLPKIKKAFGDVKRYEPRQEMDHNSGWHRVALDTVFDYSDVDTRDLINGWAWGDEPEDYEQMEAELKRRGLNPGDIADRINAILDEVATIEAEPEAEPEPVKPAKPDRPPAPKDAVKKPKHAPCPKCDGDGVAHGKPCKHCDGTGNNPMPCKACEGTGKASKGGSCAACHGTGRTVPK